MKRVLMHYGSFLVIGTVLGFVLAIYVFAIDIDVLTIPYINKPVVLTKDLTVQLDGTRITIPKETQIILKRRMQDMDVFSIDFTATCGQVSYKPDNSKKVFFQAVGG